MSEIRVLTERIAILETKHEALENLLQEAIETNKSLVNLTKQVNDMYPHVMNIVLVKGYGNFAWTTLKYLGIGMFSIITSWHYFRDHIKHFLHYIFG